MSFDSAEYTADDVTIRDLAEMLVRAIGFYNEIIFDSEKPDGAPRKLVAGIWNGYKRSPQTWIESLIWFKS